MGENSSRQIKILVNLERVRTIYASYLSLSRLNSGQNPTFVINYLTHVFEKEEKIPVQFNVKREEQDEQNEILSKIRTVYRVFRTLCKWEVEDAQDILIDALGQILTKAPDDAIDVDVERDADVNINININRAPVEQNEQLQGKDKDNFKQRVLSTPQMSSIKNISENTGRDSPERGEEMAQSLTHSNLSSRQNPEFKIKCVPSPTPPGLSEPQQEQEQAKEPEQLEESGPLYNRSLYNCDFCTKLFNHFEARDLHQVFCSESPINKKSLKKSSASFSSSSKTGDVKRKSLRKRRGKRNKSPPKLKREPDLKSVSIATVTSTTNENEIETEIGKFRPLDDTSCSMRKKIRRMISTATKGTIISAGLDPSSFPTLEKTFPCHLPTCQAKDFKSLERLANHIRTHFQEPKLQYPLKCFHPKCHKKFKNSSHFRAHLKYPHDANGNFSSIKNSPPKLKISITKCHETWKISEPPAKPTTAAVKKKNGVKRKSQRTKSETETVTKSEITIQNAAQSDFSAERAFTCIECSKKFPFRATLEKHMKMHQQPFPCRLENCSRTFNTHDKRSRHEIFHEVETKTGAFLHSADSTQNSVASFSQTFQDPDQAQTQDFESNSENPNSNDMYFFVP